jgi:hypothetical protein
MITFTIDISVSSQIENTTIIMSSFRLLPADARRLVFAYLRRGEWQLPGRLVCRAWATALCPAAATGTGTGYNDDDPAPPYRPWELIQARRCPVLADWARRTGVPWDARTLEPAAFRGDWPTLEWALHHTVPPAGLTEDDRRRIAAAVVRAGPDVMRTAPALLAPLLSWTADALVRTVHFHGSGGGRVPTAATAARFRAAWTLCLRLCGDAWDASALRAAVLGADVAVVRVVAEHPDYAVAMADPNPDGVWARCVRDCARRRRRGILVFRLIAGAGPAVPRRELPWAALADATRAGNAEFVAAFLAHPRCPAWRAAPDAAACTLSAVTRSRTSALAVALLGAFVAAGVPLHREIFRASLPYATLDTVRWLHAHGAAANLPVDELFLFAVHAGRLDVLDWLHGHYNGGFPGGGVDNPLFARTAAEMGFLAVLRRLREWGCAWDYVVLQNALLNEHLVLARWAVENGCPLTSEPIPPADEERIRRMVVRISMNA